MSDKLDRLANAQYLQSSLVIYQDNLVQVSFYWKIEHNSLLFNVSSSLTYGKAWSRLDRFPDLNFDNLKRRKLRKFAKWNALGTGTFY